MVLITHLREIVPPSCLGAHHTASKSTTMYASQQLNGFENYVRNIAIVGAGGRAGKVIAQALIEGGKHKVTAITRPDSSNTMPAGIHEVKRVDYDSHPSLVEAMKGQDVLIITMNVMAPPDSQTRLIDAAVEAGVRWVIPNEWGVSISMDGCVLRLRNLLILAL